MSEKENSRQKVFEFICAYRTKKGMSPTLAEIAKQLRFSSSDTPNYHIKNLVKDGLLRREAGTARGFSPVSREGIPIINIARSGRSDFVAEADQIRLLIDPGMFGKGAATWLYVVPGYQLLENDLLPGDLVAVKEAKSFRAGHLICSMTAEQVLIGIGRIQGGDEYIHLDPFDKAGQRMKESGLNGVKSSLDAVKLSLDVDESALESEKSNTEQSNTVFLGIVIGAIRRTIRFKPDFRREAAERKLAARFSKEKAK